MIFSTKWAILLLCPLARCPNDDSESKCAARLVFGGLRMYAS